MRLYTVLLYLYSSIIFLQTALHISGDIFTHHREHTPTVITPSGTGRTELATFRCHGGIVPTHPRQRTVANTVRPVPDAVITVLSVLLMMDEGITRNM